MTRFSLAFSLPMPDLMVILIGLISFFALGRLMRNQPESAKNRMVGGIDLAVAGFLTFMQWTAPSHSHRVVLLFSFFPMLAVWGLALIIWPGWRWKTLSFKGRVVAATVAVVAVIFGLIDLYLVNRFR